MRSYARFVWLLMLWACSADSDTGARAPSASVVVTPPASSATAGSGALATAGSPGVSAPTPGGFAGSNTPAFPGSGAAGAPAQPVTKPPAVTPPPPNTPPRTGPGAPAAPPPPMMPATPATPAPAGKTDPIIPMVTGDCPNFQNGTISYMGLGGIQISAGAKPAAATAPMVFYWHGTGSFSGEFAAMAAAVNQGVVQQGGVLVSFQDTTGGDLLSGTAIFGMSDFALTDQLLACAVRDHNIDPRRVYATGCSAGGLFTAAMLAIRSNYMAAGAPNSGGFTVPPTFQGMHTGALMTIHGAPGVDVVGLDFSQSSASADKAFKARGGFVINCNHGGMHCGGGGLAGDVWKFFTAHPFGVDPEPWSGGLPAGFSSQCMIYQ
ncbi:MAG TPA: hypothetical protein VFG30_28240 [Polyangiales bacterium]|nr:hypothetical protein [Polyangiales bacterium]